MKCHCKKERVGLYQMPCKKFASTKSLTVERALTTALHELFPRLPVGGTRVVFEDRGSDPHRALFADTPLVLDTLNVFVLSLPVLDFPGASDPRLFSDVR